MQIVSSVSATDRGLAYGDGFFTTAKIEFDAVIDWPLHKARLEECAARLFFPSLDFTLIEPEVQRLIAGTPLGVLKIMVTRGCGGRGYSLPAHANPHLLLQLLPFPEHYLSLRDRGLRLGTSSVKLAPQPLLAGLKTLNRLEQVFIKQELDLLPFDDVVVCDNNDMVVETSIGNLVWIEGSRVLTSTLDLCGIKGVYLQSLKSKIDITEAQITQEALLKADAVFVCNSLMGVVPVYAIQNKVWNRNTVTRFALEHGLYD